MQRYVEIWTFVEDFGTPRWIEEWELVTYPSKEIPILKKEHNNYRQNYNTLSGNKRIINYYPHYMSNLDLQPLHFLGLLCQKYELTQNYM